MVQFFRGIPRELDEAAMMDGCGPWRICSERGPLFAISVLSLVPLFAIFLFCQRFLIQGIAMSGLKR